MHLLLSAEQLDGGPNYLGGMYFGRHFSDNTHLPISQYLIKNT